MEGYRPIGSERIPKPHHLFWIREVVKAIPRRFNPSQPHPMPTPALTDTLQRVELADGVEIHLRIAGPAARSVAWLVDCAILLVCYTLLGIAVTYLSSWIGKEAGTGFFFLSLFLLNWFYNVAFELGPRAASPGQRLLGLKVASISGGPVSPQQSIIRNLLRTVDFLPFGYLCGLGSCLFTRRFQRLGDLVANTVVIYAGTEKPGAQLSLAHTAPAPPPVPLSREEQAALLQFFERAPQWSDQRKLELATILEPLTHARDAASLDQLARMNAWLLQLGSTEPAQTPAAASAATATP